MTCNRKWPRIRKKTITTSRVRSAESVSRSQLLTILYLNPLQECHVNNTHIHMHIEIENKLHVLLCYLKHLLIIGGFLGDFPLTLDAFAFSCRDGGETHAVSADLSAQEGQCSSVDGALQFWPSQDPGESIKQHLQEIKSIHSAILTCVFDFMCSGTGSQICCSHWVYIGGGDFNSGEHQSRHQQERWRKQAV